MVPKSKRVKAPRRSDPARAEWDKEQAKLAPARAAKAEAQLKSQIKKAAYKPDVIEEEVPVPKRMSVKFCNEVAERCCLLWIHGIEDKSVISVLGITRQKYGRWLRENKECEVKLHIAGKLTKIKGGFKEMRARMKELFEPTYLSKLDNIIDESMKLNSEQGPDFKTASMNIRWLMEKRIPAKYGKRLVLDHEGAVPIEIKTPEGFDEEAI